MQELPSRSCGFFEIRAKQRIGGAEVRELAGGIGDGDDGGRRGRRRRGGESVLVQATWARLRWHGQHGENRWHGRWPSQSKGGRRCRWPRWRDVRRSGVARQHWGGGGRRGSLVRVATMEQKGERGCSRCRGKGRDGESLGRDDELTKESSGQEDDLVEETSDGLWSLVTKGDRDEDW